MLSTAPSDLTSLNASTHCWLCSDGGGGGRNWSALSSTNGRMFAIHGVCGAAYAGGVSRQTPGPGASVGNGEVEPIGVCRPSSARSRRTLAAASRAVPDPVALRRSVRDRGERGVVERRQVRLLRGEVVHEDLVGGLGDGGVRRLPVSLAGVDGAVHRHRDVRHVDEAFALEGAGAHDRVLGDLVPLLRGVPRRQRSRRTMSRACQRSDRERGRGSHREPE